MSSIYELTNDYKQLQQLIEQGELDAELLQDTLEAITGNIKDKAENYGLVITNLTNLANGIETEAKRLKERSSAIQSNITKMQDTLLQAMIETDNLKFKTNHFTFSTRKSESLTVTDETFVPIEFIKVKEVKTVDKVELKKAVKAGLTIEGVELTQKINFSMK